MCTIVVVCIVILCWFNYQIKDIHLCLIIQALHVYSRSYITVQQQFKMIFLFRFGLVCYERRALLYSSLRSECYSVICMIILLEVSLIRASS